MGVRPIKWLFKPSWQKLLVILLSSPNWVPWLKDQRLPNSAPISIVDRFQGGEIAPAGLGASTNNTSSFDTILNALEIESALKGLENHYDVHLIQPPHASYWGHKSLVAYIPPISINNNSSVPAPDPSYRTFITAGLHGRERGAPDSLIYFIADLLSAHKRTSGLTYGNVSFSHGHVRHALGHGIVILPMANPDGLVWDQRFNNCWGNNLNFTSRAAGGRAGFTLKGVGVNVDRNFDVAWDFRRVFGRKAGDVASEDPAHELFHGMEPFSEAESRNVAWVLDQNPEISTYVNVGTDGRVVGRPWGIAGTQSEDPEQNWRNEAFDGKRGGKKDTYREYIDPFHERRFRTMSSAVASNMYAVNGNSFEFADARGVRLGASGTAMDWAYSRHIVDDKLNPVYSYNMQVGLSDKETHSIARKGGCPFYPTRKQYKRSLEEAAAGYMAFLLRNIREETPLTE